MRYMASTSLRCATLLATMLHATSAYAYTISLTGEATAYSDQTGGTFGISDVTGDPMAVTFSVSETTPPGGFNAQAIGPLTVGPYSITFTEDQWSAGPQGGGGTGIFLAPYDPVAISGPNGSISARAAGSFLVDNSGSLTWQIGFFQPGLGPEVLSISGTGQMVTPLPATLWLLLSGLGGLGALVRRRSRELVSPHSSRFIEKSEGCR
jgi:hypothetical protein